jgi:hypothetical protein
MPIRRLAFTRMDVFVTLACLAAFVAIWCSLWPQLFSRDLGGPRQRCAGHLAQIGQALDRYATENDGSYPIVPFPTGGKVIGEDASPNRILDGTGDPFVDLLKTANRSVSQNLFLLVRENYALSELFLCPNTPDAAATYHRGDLKEFFDFPWDRPKGTIGYSFPQPWSVWPSGLTARDVTWRANDDARVVIGADANNGGDVTRLGGSLLDEKTIRQSLNSQNHKGLGQNVLFADMHVNFERTPFAGMDDDNIYTAQSPSPTNRFAQTTGLKNIRPTLPTTATTSSTTTAATSLPMDLPWDTVLVPTTEAILNTWQRTP